MCKLQYGVDEERSKDERHMPLGLKSLDDSIRVRQKDDGDKREKEDALCLLGGTQLPSSLWDEFWGC